MIAQYLLNGLVTGTLHGLMAVALAPAYRALRFFDFTAAVAFALAPYLALAVDGPGRWSPAGAAVGLAAAAAAGAAAYAGLFRRLRARAASGDGLFLCSLGVYAAAEGLLVLAFGAEPREPTVPYTEAAIVLGPARLTAVQAVTAVGGGAAAVAWWVVVRGTSFGLRLAAVADDPELAAVYGVRTGGVLLAAAAAAGVTAGAAGLLSAADTGLTPGMGLGPFLGGLFGCAAGGGRVPRVYLYGLALGLAQQAAVAVLPAEWKDAVVYAAVFVLLCGRPLVRRAADSLRG